jgi:hypothetical protein
MLSSDDGHEDTDLFLNPWRSTKSGHGDKPKTLAPAGAISLSWHGKCLEQREARSGNRAGGGLDGLFGGLSRLQGCGGKQLGIISGWQGSHCERRKARDRIIPRQIGEHWPT